MRVKKKKWVGNLAVLAVFAAIVCVQTVTACQPTRGPVKVFILAG